MMELNIDTIKVGDFVKVKNGVKDPDFDCLLGNYWQGEVTEVQKKEGIIELKWDTQTLLNTPDNYLKKIILGGYDYELMRLDLSELEPASKRENTDQDRGKFHDRIYWIGMFDDKQKDKLYSKLFKGIDTSDENEMYQKWEEILSENLKFPFEAEVVESMGGGLRDGAKIKLFAVEDYEDLYGVFGMGKQGRRSITVPMCTLEAVKQNSSNYKLLQGYCIWFANQ